LKRILLALVVVASLMLTACNGNGGKAAAPVARGQDAPPASAGGTYRGTVKRGYEITFVVSADGKQVTKVGAKVLETCMGVSTSRISQLYWDGPFAVGADGTLTAAGKDPEFEELEYRFTARLLADGTATGTVFQQGAGCTTYELEWTAKKE
jgi:hypothetical protein